MTPVGISRSLGLHHHQASPRGGVIDKSWKSSNETDFDHERSTATIDVLEISFSYHVSARRSLCADRSSLVFRHLFVHDWHSQVSNQDPPHTLLLPSPELAGSSWSVDQFHSLIVVSMDLDKSFDLELCFDAIDRSHTSASCFSAAAKDSTIKISPMKRSIAKSPLMFKPKRNNAIQKVSYAKLPRVSPIVCVDAGTKLERMMMEPLHRLTPTNGDIFQPINADDKEFVTTMMDSFD